MPDRTTRIRAEDYRKGVLPDPVLHADASEHDHQVELFRWAEREAVCIRELHQLYAVPNGSYRAKATAARLKREGVRAGIPDIVLACPRGPYHGLYIELKKKGNYPTPDQRRWIESLTNYGYRAVVCVGWEAARREILDYLKLETI